MNERKVRTNRKADIGKQIIVCVLTTAGFFVMSCKSQARYLNTDTGRFMTMDTYAGNNKDPLSLHKYFYAESSPINHYDPSGNDDIGDLMAGLSIEVTLSTWSSGFGLSVGGLPGAGKGGPDVTKAVEGTLQDVQDTFDAWSPDQKRVAAFTLIDDLSALAGVAQNRNLGNDTRGSTGAWDIGDLHLIGTPKFNVNSLDYNGSTYEFGTGLWQHTAAFNSYVYYAGAINYAIFGKMYKLCHDFFAQNATFLEGGDLMADTYNEESAEDRAEDFKALAYWQFDKNTYVSQAKQFVRFGYNDTAPVITTSLPCSGSGQVYPASKFGWTWKPYHPEY